MQEQPLISVVVLSYNRPQYLSFALHSLREQTYRNLQIIVVDNRSPNSERIVQQVHNFPEVTLVCNPINVGFAAGMNKGLALAKGRYVFLTEDDIIIDSECIRHLVVNMEENPRVALSSGIMYNRSNRTIRCAGGRIALNAIYQSTFFGEGQTDEGQFKRPFEVNFVTGSFIMARLEVLKRLGGFRETFFMYFEDTELCFRVKKSGYDIQIVPSATVEHWDALDSTTDDALETHKYRNFLALYTLHARLRVLPEFFLRYVAINLIKNAIRHPGRAERLWSGLRGYFSLLPALLQERYSR